MLVQDPQTGYFHEAPDYNVAGHEGYGQVVYDGLGNPVGLIGPIFNAARRFVRNLIPGGSRSPSPSFPFPGGLLPPSLSRLVSSMSPGGSSFPTAAPAPWPYRWIRPQGPLMAGQRRLYLRCTAWPGPPGLAPADAATSGLLPPTPGAPMPPGTPMRPVSRRRRRRRR
jgi:hypothetical protein